MQELMDTYKNNELEIENFLIETIRNVGALHTHEKKGYSKLFSTFPSLELVYYCEKESLDQISANIYRNKVSYSQKGINRKYLMNKIHFNENGISVSKPYISSASGKTCITVAKLEQDKIYFLDFRVSKLLQRLGLIEIHEEFNMLNKSFYTLAGGTMVLLALFTIGYSLFDLFNSMFVDSNLSIEAIFKPIVAITLGLKSFSPCVFTSLTIFSSRKSICPRKP